MFDGFMGSGRFEKLQAGVRDLAESLGAIGSLLVNKGIITEEEFTAAKIRFGAELDQAVAASMAEKAAKMSPGEQLIYDLLGVEPKEA